MKLPLWVVFGSAGLRGLGRGLAWLAKAIVRYVGALIALGLLALVSWWAWHIHPYALIAVPVALVALLVTWRIVHPVSFRRGFAWPLRAWWRRLVVYGRWWQATMSLVGLSKTIDGEEIFPRILRVTSTTTVDEVTIKLIPGQVLEDFATQSHRLAAMFEATDCRVRTHPRSKRKLKLCFLVTDPLTEPTPLLDVAEQPDLAKLPVALREDSRVYTLKLIGTHVLIAGATGAGKGSVLWSIIRATGPLIRDRLVELWVIDPKGGMELTAGQRLFSRFCYGAVTDDPDAKAAYEAAFADFLESAVEEMHARQARMRGITRQHQPAPGDPAVFIIVDELASLTGYVVDREAKKRIAAALALLLSQGRAVGVYVIAALQDPRKEVLPDRGLFPTRIAMRLNEPEDVDMVMGKAAREQGARCHEISEDTPGVVFVGVDGIREPIRARFAFITDTEIATMCSLYTPNTASTGGTRHLQAIIHDPDSQPGTDPGTELEDGQAA